MEIVLIWQSSRSSWWLKKHVPESPPDWWLWQWPARDLLPILQAMARKNCIACCVFTSHWVRPRWGYESTFCLHSQFGCLCFPRALLTGCLCGMHMSSLLSLLQSKPTGFSPGETSTRLTGLFFRVPQKSLEWGGPDSTLASPPAIPGDLMPTVLHAVL